MHAFITEDHILKGNLYLFSHSFSKSTPIFHNLSSLSVSLSSYIFITCGIAINMITGKDMYEILAAILPLYVAMILGYGSIRWWKILTPEQSSGINRYVAMFSIPALTFNSISPINPYHLNLKLIAADSLQKFVILGALFLWNIFTKHGGGIDWTITLFSLSTLPNTLLVGVPLLSSMYGEFTTSLLISIVLMQSLVWYNVLLFFYEYRAAKLLIISQQFLHSSVNSSTKVGSVNDSEALHGDLEIGENGFELLSRDQIMLGASNTNSLQIVGFQEIIQHKKRCRRSKSCTDVNTDVFSADFGTIDISNTGTQQRFDQGVSVDKEQDYQLPQTRHLTRSVHELTNMKSIPLSECQKEKNIIEERIANKEQQIPVSPHEMTKLILSQVWRKLIQNPNIYAALLGFIWSLISSRWNTKMPSIISGSITIISKTGLGMAMFSLGIFAALQPKIIACGKTFAATSMVIKFLIGPGVMAATSYAIGIHGVLLQVSIVQAAVPEGIVPFVFAREYNLHAEILNTAVIFGLIVGLPVTITYYVLLGI